MSITSRHTGFTLIELMVTLAILAVMASIAIPMYTNYFQSSKKVECSNEMAAIQLAQEEFFAENNTYYAGVLNYSTNTLVTASQGLYRNNTSAAQRNCAYQVVLTGGGSGYTLTATGVNELAGVSSGALFTANK